MPRFLVSDEEMGKKDDDHWRTRTGSFRASQSWQATTKVRPRKTLMRLGLVGMALFGIYIFFSNIPTDVPIRDHRRPSYSRDQPKNFAPSFQLSTLGKGGSQAEETAQDAVDEVKQPVQGYNGPLKFMYLASTLQVLSGTNGLQTLNKNILFAASSLQSASALLPMACQMGMESRNYVHFALISRSLISIEELRSINGIGDSCQITFHDARPDYSLTSTEARMRLAVERLLYHIQTYMHPQAILIDGSQSEEAFFLAAMRSKAAALGIPSVIELPQKALAKFSWITRLDSAALSAWHRVHVDILIHASPGASGSLIRLLKSLAAADYTSCSMPHLTIELPPDADEATIKFLDSFQWPPPSVPNPTHVKLLSLRRRTPRTALTEEESSVRFLESFWPTNPETSHVLVLSQQAELSSHFFHYLHYTLLEYFYSTPAIQSDYAKRLMALSLDLPSTLLDASQPFTPPSDVETSFLWQSPNSNAVLFLGQKWVELHSFASRLLSLQHASQGTLAPFISTKVVSTRHPAWVEHALQLARARGYLTLYPSRRTAGNLGVVHTELYRPPEEYTSDAQSPGRGEEEVVLSTPSLLDSLPNQKGPLPHLGTLPLLAWKGEALNLADLVTAAAEYAKTFRKAVPRCEGVDANELIAHWSGRDLFCEK